MKRQPLDFYLFFQIYTVGLGVFIAFVYIIRLVNCFSNIEPGIPFILIKGDLTAP